MWPPGPRVAGPALLRLTVALDDREEKLVEVRTATGIALGSVDVRFADPHQRFGLTLDAERARLAAEEGVELRLARATTPLWIFAGPPAPARHRPHLVALRQGDERSRLSRRLAAVDSVQPFGWMEGCVLEALTDMAAAFPGDGARVERAARRHLGLYLGRGRLEYEDPRSRVADGRIYGVEATLPFAVVARLLPCHPAIDLAVDAWRTLTDGDGCVRDAATTAEGGYTVGYPMAVVARGRGLPELGRAAVRQQLVRRERLLAHGAVHLRQLAGGRRTFRHWARAYAWYLLGLVRTARELDGMVDTDELWAAFRRTARSVVDAQGRGGLWYCFIDMDDSGVEASGSAGIAAALALGHEAGRLERWAADAAVRAWAGLTACLTPDGWLAGSSQANKGGEQLQLCGYRVISGSGTGLMGQLGAALVRLAARGVR
ncbi:MAG TPA: glycoside hydrolase family 88 protein [Candidatus Dormibacteraeota bacterium]|nr:glycoside hydrolase family 88 protein [Candidatus Dormibacteraeota bacterium]